MTNDPEVALSYLERRALLDACRAALLFHSGGEWNAAKSQEWYRLTETNEATTRTLCDSLRHALKLAGEGT